MPALDLSLPFVLQTNTSDRGLGAILFQVVEGEEFPMLSIRWKLLVRETKYSTNKECLAIKWVVFTLWFYLLGHPFNLCSDHAHGFNGSTA